MKDLDNIEDWYRDELNNYNVEPDANLWDSLSGDLDASTPLTDETISDWYKKEVSKLEERPDYTVWEKLATQLDTASVWDKLALSLNRYDQLIWWRNVAIRGTAIFLLFFASYLTYNNYNTSDNQTADNATVSVNKNTTTQIKPQTISNQPNKENSVYEAAFVNSTEKNVSKGASKNFTADKNSVVSNSKITNKSNLNTPQQNKKSDKEKVFTAIQNAKETVNPAAPKKRSRSKENVNYASLEKIQQYYSSIYKDKLDELKSETERGINTNINKKRLSEKDISQMYRGSEYLVKKDNDKIVFNTKRFSSYSMFGVYTRRIYAGFNIGLKKQGMITSLKSNSPLSEYKQNSLLDFGSNIGATVGLIVSDNLNIETNINLNSTSGYKRGFEGEGVTYQENLNMNYTSVSLLAKKMNNKSTFDNKVYSTNLIGGVYASYFRSAVSDINGVSRKLDSYCKLDAGIILGIEQDRYISKTLIITPGIRYNQGLLNTSKEDNAYKSSTNFSLEFNLGVKYIFLKKGK